MNLQNGQTIDRGRYTIVDRLGQGGMGAVYLATDGNLPGQQVAIKQSLERSRLSQQQFRSEADTLSKLNHPNLPRITNFFTDQGLQYLVMDYIDGQDLRQILTQRSEPLEEKVVMGWLDQIMDALEYMHTWTDPKTGQLTPIIHRDIKPGNIKQASDGRIVLVDFGIAKVAAGGGTITGARAHTPGFSPVEQYTGTGTDFRSDVYSLGATLYSLLTRKIPPEAPDIAANTATFPSPRSLNSRLSRQADSVIMRAMKTKPAERYQTIAEMRKGLVSRWPEIRIPTPLGRGGGNDASGKQFFPKTTTSTKRPIASTTERGVRNPILLTAGLTLIVFLVAVVMILRSANGPAIETANVVAGEPTNNIVEVTPARIIASNTSTPTPERTATEAATTRLNTPTVIATDTPTESAATPTRNPTRSSDIAQVQEPTDTPDAPTRIPFLINTPTERPTESVATPTERPNTPTRTPTREPTQTLTRTPTQAPTRTPTSTRVAPTRTSTQTPTRTPATTPTAAVSQPVEPVQQPISTGTVRLLRPLDPTIRGSVTFEWESTVTLRQEEYFELIFWRPGQDPFRDGFSPAGAKKEKVATVNLDRMIGSLPQLSAGRDYLWGVRLVTKDPFVALSYLGGEHQFRLEGSGGGGGSSSSNPTPTPRG